MFSLGAPGGLGLKKSPRKQVMEEFEDEIDGLEAEGKNAEPFIQRKIAELEERNFPNVPVNVGGINEGYTIKQRDIPTAASFIYNIEGPGPRYIRKVASSKVKSRAGATRADMTRRYVETLNEAKIYKELIKEHGWKDYILPFHSSEKVGDSVILTFKYVDGMDVFDYIRSASPSPSERAKLLELAAKAVNFCHKAGISHQDIKAENFYVAIAPGGALRVYLFDFGTSEQNERGFRKDIRDFKEMVEGIIGKLTFKEGDEVLKISDIPEDDTFFPKVIKVLKAVSESEESAAAVAGAGKGGGRRRSRKGKSKGRGKTRSRK